MIFKLKSEENTHKAGQILGEYASPGDLFCLIGTLGAGKTYLTKGIAKSLGIDPEKVTSPTFTLVQEHMGRMPLYHWDLYRLDDPKEALELGLEEHLYGDGLTVIEWAELLDAELPKERLTIKLNIENGFRTIEIVPTKSYEKVYGEIKERFMSCFA